MSLGDAFTNQPIVIDNGSGIIKAGFAGKEIPSCYFPTFVCRPKYPRVMVQALEGDVFIGPKGEEHRGLMHINYPMEHGIVTDWDDMEKIWRYVYSTEQLHSFPEDHPLLLTEAPLNPLKNRERMAEIFFESLAVPAVFISIQAVLGLYATGRTTGVVLDSGDGVTHAVPVYEGFALPHNIARMDVAGRDVTRYLRFLLRKEGYDLQTSPEFELVRSIKEKLCYVSRNLNKEELSSQDFVLPDGEVLSIGAARSRASEILFRPEIIGKEYSGVHEMVVSVISKCDRDMRNTFYGNVVLSGGSTLFRGFGDRLLNDIKRQCNRNVKIRISAPKERLYTAWIGGSILASLNTFRLMWVSKKEYEDNGVRIIHRKMF